MRTIEWNVLSNRRFLIVLCVIIYNLQGCGFNLSLFKFDVCVLYNAKVKSQKKHVTVQSMSH